MQNWHDVGKQYATAYDSIFEPGQARPNRNGSLWDSIRNRLADQEWLGAPTFDEMDRRISKGWPEGVDRLMHLPLGDVPVPESVRRRRVRSDFGDSVDMQKVYKGDLARAWERTVRLSVNVPPTITLLVNLSCEARIEASKLFWKGAAILRLTEALSVAGYNVAIWGTNTSTNTCGDEQEACTQFICIRESDSPLDVSNLAALICMPGYKRTYLHRGLIEQADRIGKRAKTNLGYSHDIAEVNRLTLRAIQQFPHIPQEVYYLPQIVSQKEAESWMTETLAKIGGRAQ